MVNLRSLVIAGLLSTVAINSYSYEHAAKPSLIVRGQATLYKPADELQMNVGVVTSGTTAREALQSNSTDIAKVIQSIASAGLQKGEYKTGRFSIRPLYSRRPESAPPDWKAKIVAYEVTNTIGIKTDKITTAGDIIDKAILAGANSVDSISFNIKNPQDYRPELIQAATRNGMAEAQALSEAAKIRLGSIWKLSLDEAQVYPVVREERFLAKTMAASAAPPIVPGEVSLNGSVTIVYIIENP